MGSRVPDAPILRHHVCPEGLECANRLLVFAVRMAQGEPWLMISEFNLYFFTPLKWKMEPTEDMKQKSTM